MFKHNCKKCFKSGLMRCPKCDGDGVMTRAKRDTREAMKIERGGAAGAVDDGGLFDCSYCSGKGVKPCGQCQGQGWEFLPFVNYRKFQPHPVFEEFHWSRDRMKAKNVDFEKNIEKATLNKSVEEIDADRKKIAKENKKLEKASEKAAKAEKTAAKAAKAAKPKSKAGKAKKTAQTAA